jgi:hypothetical protein
VSGEVFTEMRPWGMLARLESGLARIKMVFMDYAGEMLIVGTHSRTGAYIELASID